MLMRVDDSHTMADSSGNLVRAGALNRHVGNEIGDAPHLVTGVSFSHNLHTRIARVLSLGIEVLEALKCRAGPNPSLVVGHDDRGIAVEIRTRQTFGHLRVNADGVFGQSADKLPPKLITVVDSQRWNLEDSAVRITN